MSSFNPTIRNKKSIYENEEPSHDNGINPNELELGIRSLRHNISAFFGETSSQIRQVTDEWIQTERNIANTVGKYVEPNENILPGALYVVTSGFLGSIVAKNRGIVPRFAIPFSFTLLSLGYFFPRTCVNIMKATDVGSNVLDTTHNFTSSIDRQKKSIEKFIEEKRK